MKFFKIEEFACPCCKVQKMDQVVMDKIDLIRAKMDTPLKINSAYRCPSHNAAVSGKSNSLHLKGQALDVCISKFSAEQKRQFLDLVSQAFCGIGIGKTFIHMDIGAEKLWVY